MGHPALNELQLQANGITDIAVGTFANHGNILILRIFGNGLTSIPGGAFQGLTQLTKLYMNSNPITRIRAGTFTPFAATITDLFIQDNTQLTVIEDNSLNAITNRPITLSMANTLSTCALAPDDTFDCICAPPHTGGNNGYCDSVTAAPTMAPTHAPTDVPSTAAPVDPIVTAAPVTAPPSTSPPTGDDSIGRDGEDEPAVISGKSGKSKKGKGSSRVGDDTQDRTGAEAPKSAKKGKGDTGIDDGAQDRTGAEEPKSKKGGKSVEDDDGALDRAASGHSGSGSAADKIVGDTTNGGNSGKSSKKTKKGSQLFTHMTTGNAPSSASSAALVAGGCLVVLAAMVARRVHARRAGYHTLPTTIDGEPAHNVETDFLLADDHQEDYRSMH